jgi:aminopeptidase N
LLCALAALACLSTRAHAQDNYPRLASLDALEYRIELIIPDEGEEIQAETSIDFAVTADRPRNVSLDFGALKVDEVRVNGRAMTFRREGDKLVVTLGSHNKGEHITVAIRYHGRPADGLFFKRNKFGGRTVFADNWPNRAHHWFPSVDHPYDKAKVEFAVTAPAQYRVVANGKLVETADHGRGWRLTRWREDADIPVYCMVVGATEFAVADAGSFGGVPLSYWLYADDLDNGRRDYGRALAVADYFTKLIGPYPYEKLALVESSTQFGGMENSSSIFFDEKAYDGSGKLEGTVAHEIAHQWFGDSVTESDWHHLWLSEGFATYFGALFFEHADGPARFREIMLASRERYMKDADAVSRPIHDPSVTDLFKLLNRNNYEKGAWVLHMLRHVMGDEKFFAGVREYYQTYRDRNASTEDFRRVMEKHAGGDLGWFFREWIYERGFPVYVAKWNWNTRIGFQTCVTVEQRGSPSFDMPLDVEIKYDDASVLRTTIRVSDWVKIQCYDHKRRKPTAVAIDPDDWVLKTLTLQKEKDH